MKVFSTLTLFLCFTLAMVAQNYSLQSPDGTIRVEISTHPELTYMVFHQNDQLTAPSPVAMAWSNGVTVGRGMRIRSARPAELNETVDAPLYKKSVVHHHCHQLTLSDEAGYDVIFRAYNQGVAFRVVAGQNAKFNVVSENTAFYFPGDPQVYVAYNNLPHPYAKGMEIEPQFRTSFENTYVHLPVSQLEPNRLAFLPVLIECARQKKVVITETDLQHYPGMFVRGDGNSGFKSVFAPYASAEVQGGHNDLQMLVTAREPFLAKCEANQHFPWRILAVAASDEQLLNSDLAYVLAQPSRIDDVSWIKPGKVAWDWWNDWKLYGVPFQAGINTETYRYYIDFASKYGIEYVILDEGWSPSGVHDLFRVVPEIDLPALVQYASEKQVGIILWAGYVPFERNMDAVCSHYAQMGIKGFKIDFMDRDDQAMVDFTWKVAETCAKHRLLVNLHGMFKPAGIQRTYPNVLNFEGVHGLEQMKWAESADQVTYDVTLPFVRMVAGPMDYTPGAMRNATRENFKPIYSEPMSQGTRCRQLALYVVLEAPLNMMCDNPVNYEREPECTRLIASVPVVWDQTVPLGGAVAQYVAVARRKGTEWFVGALTNWQPRTININFSYLPRGKYRATLYLDGPNAHQAARDYRIETREVDHLTQMEVHLAPGGGCVLHLTPLL